MDVHLKGVLSAGQCPGKAESLHACACNMFIQEILNGYTY